MPPAGHPPSLCPWGATGRHRHRPFAKNGSKMQRPAGHYWQHIFAQRVITDNISVNALGANMRFVQVNSSRIVQKWVPTACWSAYTAGDRHVRCPRRTYCASTAGHRGSMGKRATQEMVAGWPLGRTPFGGKKNGGQ